MRLFQGVRAKLGDANDALATARKSWRDDAQEARQSAQDERQASLNAQAAELDQRLNELRQIESRRFWRKLKTATLMLVVTCVAFYAGFAVKSQRIAATESTSRGSTITGSETVSAPAAPVAPPPQIAPTQPKQSGSPGFADPDEAARRGRYGVGKQFKVGYYCLDKEKQGEATLDECLTAAALAVTSAAPSKQ